MQIGLRHLGGHPRAFYGLEPEEQIDVLAVLQVERELAEQPRGQGRDQRSGGVNPGDRVTFESDGARQFWGPVFRS